MATATGKSRKKRDSDSLAEFHFHPFVRPTWSTDQLRQLDRTAKVYAANNASDPFAYSRALAHMKNGLADPSDFNTNKPTA